MFNIEKISSNARLGHLQLNHGEVTTPVFMPVGTKGTVKSMSQEDLSEMNIEIILANTYHLYLKPGDELIKIFNGLHKFCSWNKNILTDSGGFQVFSLSNLNKITDDGVIFKSHIDGSEHFLTPRKSMMIQKNLNSDIVMAFDECPKLPTTNEYLEKAVNRTIKWAKICKDFELNNNQKLFGILQGGLDLNLRKYCLDNLISLNFDGIAIGGLSVGEKNSEMWDFLANFIPFIPKSIPRYLMGVGTPIDILKGVSLGIDMFDCVMPTRNARNGQALTSQGPKNLKNAKYRDKDEPLDAFCDCKICRHYNISYLRHLVNVGEYLGGHALSYHNIYFYINMMKEIRKAIKEDSFDNFYHTFLSNYQGEDYADGRRNTCND